MSKRDTFIAGGKVVFISRDGTKKTGRCVKRIPGEVSGTFFYRISVDNGGMEQVGEKQVIEMEQPTLAKEP